jgi:hypothetical protein
MKKILLIIYLIFFITELFSQKIKELPKSDFPNPELGNVEELLSIKTKSFSPRSIVINKKEKLFLVNTGSLAIYNIPALEKTITVPVAVGTSIEYYDTESIYYFSYKKKKYYKYSYKDEKKEKIKTIQEIPGYGENIIWSTPRLYRGYHLADVLESGYFSITNKYFWYKFDSIAFRVPYKLHRDREGLIYGIELNPAINERDEYNREIPHEPIIVFKWDEELYFANCATQKRAMSDYNTYFKKYPEGKNFDATKSSFLQKEWSIQELGTLATSLPAFKDELDLKAFRKAQLINTIKSYSEYCRNFSNGSNYDIAISTKRELENKKNERERIRTEREEQRLLAERQRKEKERQEYIAKRIARIKNLTEGDVICYSEDWTNKEHFLGYVYSKTNFKMKATLIIDEIKNQNIRLIVNNVESTNSNYYNSIKIGNLEVDEDEIIWLSKEKISSNSGFQFCD